MRKPGQKARIKWWALKGWDSICDSVVLGPGFPLRHVARLLRWKTYVTHIRGVGHVNLRPLAADGGVFSDVFQRKEYDLASFPQYKHVLHAYRQMLAVGRVPVIVDCGANVGAVSIWFSLQFPRAHVVAVEPDHDNARVCRLNTRRWPNIRVIEAAIGSERGSVSLQYSDSVSIQTERNEKGSVPVCTIADALEIHHVVSTIFIVKIDIEGFEHDLFADNLNWLDNVVVVIIEPHDWLFPGKGTSKNFQRALAERGFELLISGSNLIYCQIPSSG